MLQVLRVYSPTQGTKVMAELLPVFDPHDSGGDAFPAKNPVKHKLDQGFAIFPGKEPFLRLLSSFKLLF